MLGVSKRHPKKTAKVDVQCFCRLRGGSVMSESMLGSRPLPVAGVVLGLLWRLFKHGLGEFGQTSQCLAGERMTEKLRGGVFDLVRGEGDRAALRWRGGWGGCFCGVQRGLGEGWWGRAEGQGKVLVEAVVC